MNNSNETSTEIIIDNSIPKLICKICKNIILQNSKEHSELLYDDDDENLKEFWYCSKCDNYISLKWDNEKERTEEENLKYNQQQRLATFNKYYEFIINLLKEKKDKKEMKYRRRFCSFLSILSNRVYDSEDQEYSVICKFGRGMWDETLLEKTFNSEELKIIIEIAKGYGAFSY